MKQFFSKYLSLIVIGVILVAIPLTVYLANQTQIFRPRAAGEAVTLNLSPSTATKQVGESFDVAVLINTQTNNVSFVDLNLTFNKDLLQMSSFTPSSVFNTIVTNGPANNTNGTFHYTAGNNTTSVVTGSSVNIGTIRFTGRAVGVAQVGLTGIEVTVRTTPPSDVAVVPATGTYTIIAVTASPSPSAAASRIPCTTNPVCSGQCSAPANTCSTNNGTKNSCVFTGPVDNCLQVAAPNQPCTLSNCSSPNVCNSSGQCVTPQGGALPVLSLVPSSATKQVGDNLDVQFSLNTSGMDVSFVDLNLTFNKDLLEMQSFTPSSIMNTIVLNGPPNNSAGTFHFVAGNNSTAQVNSNNVNLGTAQFRAKAIGTALANLSATEITIRENPPRDVNSTSGNGTYTIVGASPSPSPSAGCPADQPFCPRTGTCLAPNICNPPSPSPAVSVTPSVVPSPQGGTKCYKIAEDLATLNSIPDEECLPYTSHPLVTNITFADPTPGRKFVFVRYYSNSNQTSDATAFIDLIADPEITGCSIEFKGNTVGFVVVGDNFGTVKGKIQVGNASPVNFQEWSNTRVIATVPTNQFKDPGLQTVPVTVTRSDGLIARGACSNKANSNLSLGAKLFCPQVQPHVISGVDLKIVEATRTGQVVFNQKVTIDETGVVKDKLPLLKENFGYKLAIKVPRGVRQVIEFIGQLGTTNVTDFTVHGKRLALGDIAPQGGDGAINTLDKGEMNVEWNLVEEDPGRPADLNEDTRVNSVDWACMRYDFGKLDAPDPTPGPLSTLRIPLPAPSVIFNSIDQSI